MIGAKIAMAVWLGLLLGAAVFAAAQPRRLPFVIALNRVQQRRIAVIMAGGAIGEIITLGIGGFWS